MTQWVDFTTTTFAPKFGSSAPCNSHGRKWAETGRSQWTAGACWLASLNSLRDSVLKNKVLIQSRKTLGVDLWSAYTHARVNVHTAAHTSTHMHTPQIQRKVGGVTGQEVEIMRDVKRLEFYHHNQVVRVTLLVMWHLAPDGMHKKECNCYIYEILVPRYILIIKKSDNTQMRDTVQKWPESSKVSRSWKSRKGRGPFWEWRMSRYREVI